MGARRPVLPVRGLRPTDAPTISGKGAPGEVRATTYTPRVAAHAPETVVGRSRPAASQIEPPRGQTHRPRPDLATAVSRQPSRLGLVVANSLTSSRVVLAALAVRSTHRGDHGRSTALLVAASITDAADGLAARSLNGESKSGAMADTAADRSLHGALLHAAWRRQAVPKWLLGIIAGRELAITVVGAAAVATGRRGPGVVPSGRAATALIAMGGSAALIGSGDQQRDWLRRLGTLLLAGAVPLSYGSAWFYARSTWVCEEPRP